MKGIFLAAGLGSRGTRVIARHTGITKPVTDAPIEARAPASVTAADAQARVRAQRFGSLGGRFDAPQAARPFASASAPPASSNADPRDVRVDAICDKILAELRTSPDAVKEIFRKPEETIAALRSTCRDLTRRERDLRRFLSPEEDSRLSREREALARRIEGEGDEVTKMRLASALAALDAQRDQRAELARSAARFDAEHTRISYTLESLHTQIVRMRSADSSSVDVAGAGLRRSLDLLSHEVNALADALERVNRGDVGKLREVGEGPAESDEGPPGARGTREKA